MTSAYRGFDFVARCEIDPLSGIDTSRIGTVRGDRKLGLCWHGQ